MKQILSIFAFVVLAAFAASAQSTNGPVMKFDQTTIDYGTIDKGSERIRKFKFANVGNEPLIIKAAKGSCGCTVPTYAKEPIMPGESSVIEVNYDTQRVGAFQKSVTIETNEANGTHTLNIKGDVKEPKQLESIPAAPKNGLKQ
jgi:Protein of unknown function (DUF1573)